MSDLAKAKQPRNLYPMWTVIALFMMFLFGYVVPGWGPVTPLGAKIFGVFIGALLMTIFTNQTFWPALMALFAMVFHGYLSANAALSGWLGSSTVAQFLFLTALSGALADSGAPVVIARRLLNPRITGGRPLLYIFVYFMTVLLVSTLFNAGTAVILIMFPIWDGIREAAGYKKEDPICKLMLLGTYLAAAGSYILPFKGIHLATITIVRSIMESYGLAFDGAAYFISTTSVLVGFFVVYTLFIGFVYRCDLEPMRSFDIESVEGLSNAGDKFNKRQIILLIALIIGILYNITAAVVPTTSSFFQVYTSLTATWVWILIIAVLCIFQEDGKPFLKGPKIMKDHTLWTIVCLIGAFSLLGGAISSDDLGIKAWIGNLLEPMLGNAAWPILIISAVAIATIGTNFMNGMPVSFALSTVMMPFACNLELTAGINSTVLGAAIIFCGQIAFMTYGAMVYAALLLDRPEIDQKFIWTRGSITVGIYIVVASILFTIFGYVL